MNNAIIGQYIPGNSILHRADPRIKIIAMMILIASTFLLNELLYMGILLLVMLLIVVVSRIPLLKVLKGLKGLVFLLTFTVVLQLAYTKGTPESRIVVFDSEFIMTYYNLMISFGLFLLWILTKRFIPFPFLYFLLLLFLSFYLQATFLNGDTMFSYNIKFYKAGVEKAGFIFFRVVVVIIISSLLTWTTTSIDLNNGFESVIRPLKIVRINTAVIAMMLSLVLRFVPTLLEESGKIMKSQASRGADFREGKLRDKIRQIISLLVPMFVISFKRAEDLANAMESRGYIIGAPRTKLDEMKIKYIDIIIVILCIVIMCSAIGSNFI